jgi:hypothetical protein
VHTAGEALSGNMMNGKNLVLLSAFVILLISALVVFGIIRKKKRREEINQIRERIASGVGEQGDDFAKLLYNVKPDTSFSQAEKMAKQIKDAKGIIWDTEDDVYAALAGKTKSQIKMIQQVFESNWGSLDLYLKSFMKDSEFNKALGYVRTAK